MITLLTVFHVIVCIFLILVVLVQQGKGADWAGAFGGGGSQTTFGARSTGSILERATTGAAIIFMITSIALAILISGGSANSVIREGAKTTAPAPATPAPGGAPAQPGQPAPAPAPQNAPAPAPAQPPVEQGK
jgi:preprotein translocase subunit SecG